jgi:hypothetical protein
MLVSMIKLNMRQIYSELGLKSISQFRQETVSKGKQSANNYIGKVASRGDRMMAIQSKQDVFPQFAREDTRTKELGLKMDIVPKQLVKMQIVKRPSIDVRV